MEVDVFGSYTNVKKESIIGRDVVVIDVYRTTSVIITALARNARCIIPVESVDEAWELYYQDGSDSTLLGGEREALPIDGFHLGNSPKAYTEEKVRGKQLVLTTSNGTRAISVCTGAERVYIASFLNASCVAEELIRRSNDIAVVCSGTFGKFAIEDGLCGGIIASYLVEKGNSKVAELGIAMADLLDAATDIRSILQKCSVAYRYLERTGYNDDIDFCLQRDIYDILPFYDNKSITV